MDAVFREFYRMSLTGSWLIFAVLLLRMLFKKAPKRIICVLWGMVGLRLVCPSLPESRFSLIPDGDRLRVVAQESGLENITLPVAQVPAGNTVSTVGMPVGAETAPDLGHMAAIVWLIGAAVMLSYMLVSYIRLKCRLADAVLLRDNIKQSGAADTPFVLGLLRPIIYLPYSVRNEDIDYVVAHERAHIGRRDHLWKPLGFVLLSVYWFNPVIWAAYIFLCRDIEAACDEKVIAGMEIEGRRAYSMALLNCAVHRRGIAACPLAFGEIGVKERVTNVMHYKKPALWVIVLAVLACAVAAVCFLTNPVDDKTEKTDEQTVGEIQPDELHGSAEQTEQTKTEEESRVLSIHQTLNTSGGGQIVIDASVEEIPSGEVRMYDYKPIAVTDETREGLFDIYFGDRADEVFRKSETQDIWQLGETMSGDFYRYETVFAMDGSGDTVFNLSYRRPNLNPLDENFLGGAEDSICTITAEYALDLCDKLMLAFEDHGDYKVDSIHAYGAYISPEMFFEEAPPEPFYWITYKRQLDGMPVTAYNDLYFFVNDDGVQDIHGALYDVQPLETDAELLSVTEAVEMLQKNTDSLDPGDQETVRYGNIRVGNICLEYLVRKQDGETVIVPVWRFEIGETEEERILNRNLVLAVNAFTGEVIGDFSSYGSY